MKSVDVLAARECRTQVSAQGRMGLILTSVQSVLNYATPDVPGGSQCHVKNQIVPTGRICMMLQRL